MLEKNYIIYIIIISTSLVSTVYGAFPYYDTVSNAVSHIMSGFYTPTTTLRGVNENHSYSESVVIKKYEEKNIYEEKDLRLHTNTIVWVALKHFMEKCKTYLKNSQKNKARINPAIWKLYENDCNTAEREFEKRDKTLFPEKYKDRNEDNKTEHSHIEKNREKSF